MFFLATADERGPAAVLVQGRRSGLRARRRRAHHRLPELRRQRHVPVDRQRLVRTAGRPAVRRLRAAAAACASTASRPSIATTRCWPSIPEAQFIVRVRATRGLPQLPALHPQDAAGRALALRAARGSARRPVPTGSERLGARRPAAATRPRTIPKRVRRRTAIGSRRSARSSPIPGRGLLMGNRGVLHDAQQRIVRDSQVRRWIACRLEFRGRGARSCGPTAGRSCSSSTRPPPCGRPPTVRRVPPCRLSCASSRLAHARRRRSGRDGSALHPERRMGPWHKRAHTAELGDLPDGAYVALDDDAWLVLGDALLQWSTGATRPRADGRGGRGHAADAAVDRRGDATRATAPAIHPSARRPRADKPAATRRARRQSARPHACRMPLASACGSLAIDFRQSRRRRNARARRRCASAAASRRKRGRSKARNVGSSRRRCRGRRPGAVARPPCQSRASTLPTPA